MLSIVSVRQQNLDRSFDEVGITVERVSIGECELGCFDLQMDELGAHRIEAVEIESFKQRELLQSDKTLTPGARLQNAIAAVVVADRLLDRRGPSRHVRASQHAAMGAA